ncbi:MAG: DUF512 domain-containing protein [Nitrospirae bacterium]|nr:DUF512 domain-containing protein [Nitrospirota bacterium]
MSLTIEHITEGSAASKLGLKDGDTIIEINNNPVKDIIDYMYYSQEGSLSLKIQRGSRTYLYKITKKGKANPGFDLKEFRVKGCRNKCIFCFVNQLPKGMRKTLYLKDDDYRMSFLYGNYITLTNLAPADKKRIFEQRLSPMYISVHTTNNDLRKKILGNQKTEDILEEIQEFVDNKIKLHTQIVVVPQVNDGEELSKTIRDLYKFYPHVASIAVVPVGLTRFKNPHVKPFEKSDALKAVEIVNQFSRRFKRRHGDPIVYAADELFIKANLPFPSVSEYGDLSQIENGVGLVSSFLDSIKKLKLPKKIEPKKVITFTGASFAPYLKEALQKLKAIDGLSLELFKIENSFFGNSVTVTGLLTGRDIIKSLMGKAKGDCLLVPNITLRDGENTFLDNVTLKNLEESLEMKVAPIEPTPEGLLEGILDGCNRKN